MTYRFRPPLWSIPVTLSVGALFVLLGLWQLHRGQHKQALEAAFQQQGAGQQVLRLTGASLPPEILAAPRATASGHYDPARQLLLDNQSRNEVPGYHVWTPLKLADGAWLIVDRGWVAADPDRRRLPDLTVTDQAREVSGFFRPLPQPGLRLAADPCAAQGFPRVLSYPTHEQMACILGGPVADGVLLLDPLATDGFVREWSLPNPIPPARHYAYAAQWFAFAATLLFLFVKLNLRRTP